MSGLSERPSSSGSRERAWSSAWIVALAVVGVCGLLQWVAFAPGGVAFQVARDIEIASVILGIVAIFRWAKLRAGSRGS